MLSLLLNYGEATKPALSELKPVVLRLMSDLLSRRRQLITLQMMEENSLGIMPKDVSINIKPILTAIKNQIGKVDKKLLAVTVAMGLLSNMPELVFITNKQAASLSRSGS